MSTSNALVQKESRLSNKVHECQVMAASTRVVNSRSYTRATIDEGKAFLLSGTVPARLVLLDRPTRVDAFKGKWRGAIIGEVDGHIYMDKRRVVAKEDVAALLQMAYNDPSQHGGRDKLHQRLLEQYIGVSRRAVMEFITNVESHQLHLAVPRPVINQASITQLPFQHWQLDLIDMSTLAGINNGDHWILTCIDKMCKFAFALPLKNKSGPVVAQAIETILASSPRLPSLVQTDNGSEFITLQLKSVLTRLHVKHVFSDSYSPQSNGCIERFNGSLKRNLYRFLTQFKSKKWNDILAPLVHNYNSAIHSSTSFAPLVLRQAALDDNKTILDKARAKLQTKAARMLKADKQPPIVVGDTVRVSFYTMSSERKDTFRKSYMANWSKKIYVVANVSKGTTLSKPQYKLKDLEGNPIQQRYYRSHLQRIDRDALKLNSEPRPDFSGGAIFNQEEHAKKMASEGPQHSAIKPPTQGDERQRGVRAKVAKIRLIDELIQEEERKK